MGVVMSEQSRERQVILKKWQEINETEAVWSENIQSMMARCAQFYLVNHKPRLSLGHNEAYMYVGERKGNEDEGQTLPSAAKSWLQASSDILKGEGN